MHFGFLVLIILVSGRSFSSPRSLDPSFQDLACPTQLYSVLEKWEAPTKWLEDTRDASGTLSLRSATEDPQIFLKLVLNSERTTIIRWDSKKADVIQWQKEEQCQPHFQLIRFNNEKPKDFTDHQLDQMLAQSAKQNNSGLIYVWSPNMRYSIEGFSEAEKVCQELGVQFIPLLDPMANMKQATLIANREKWSASSLVRLEADQLMARNMLNHFPSFIVYSKGRISGSARLGYDKSAVLKSFLRQSMSP